MSSWNTKDLQVWALQGIPGSVFHFLTHSDLLKRLKKESKKQQET